MSSSLPLQTLPLGHLAPRGWLLAQLRVQADGLSGHLDEFWPDVAHSKWIGGHAEGWERGPYWLDGIVPLAFLLGDERLIAKARYWVDTILARQHADGWLGELHDDHEGSGESVLDPWPMFVLFKALIGWQEATGDERIVPALSRALGRIDALLEEKPLDNWAKMRWPESMWSLNWLQERTGEAWLGEMARRAQAQGYPWRGHFADFKFPDWQPQWTLENHVVNQAMALKEAAVWAPHDDAAGGAEVAQRFIDVLDEFHGQATGIFTGDESLAGRNPSQGTELCAVVEYLFSLEVLLARFGDANLADRWERIAFNALPATFKPDMWAHQYVQQANQAICVLSPERIYTNNFEDANLFGLEPNFGCCTANMHQGWPKFAAHLWMKTAGEAGLAALSYAPCQVGCEIEGARVEIEVEGDYPFGEVVRLRVSSLRLARFALHLRIPDWAKGARVEIDGEENEAQPGAFHRIERPWSGDTQITLHLPMSLRVEERFNGALSIERGPLVYALPIEEQWRHLRGELPHADWEVLPLAPWNYALELDPSAPEHALRFESSLLGGLPPDGSSPSGSPFSPDRAPNRLKISARLLPGWRLEKNAAQAPPPSPVQGEGASQQITLIPYGCTNLRITEFPWTAPTSAS